MRRCARNSKTSDLRPPSEHVKLLSSGDEITGTGKKHDAVRTISNEIGDWRTVAGGMVHPVPSAIAPAPKSLSATEQTKTRPNTEKITDGNPSGGTGQSD